MKAFKIENFKTRYPDKKFPDFSHLSDEQTREIRILISRKIKSEKPDDDLFLTLEIERMGVATGIDAHSENFNLKDALQKLMIPMPVVVYINWYRFDDIDFMQLDDLSNYFDDIRYESADDIDVFDDTFSWIVSIAHHGSIKVLKLSTVKSSPI